MLPWLTSEYNSIAQRASNRSLHHALIVKGAAGIGKSQFTHQIAHFLLCQNKTGNIACGTCQSCQLFVAQSHPDFHLIESEKQIGVDLIRGAIQKLIGTAQLSGNKVLVMHHADSMTEASANALLKTLEEPTDNTYLFLVCDQAERLLPTILSRCEKIQLYPPSTEVCLKWLNENGHQGLNEDFIKIYANAPLLIQQKLSDDKALKYNDFLKSISEIQTQQIVSTELATKWQDDLHTVITWIGDLIASALRRFPDSEELWSCNNLCQTIKRVAGNPGINKTLHLSGLLEQLGLLEFNLVEDKMHVG